MRLQVAEDELFVARCRVGRPAVSSREEAESRPPPLRFRRDVTPEGLADQQSHGLAAALGHGFHVPLQAFVQEDRRPLHTLYDSIRQYVFGTASFASGLT